MRQKYGERREFKERETEGSTGGRSGRERGRGRERGEKVTKGNLKRGTRRRGMEEGAGMREAEEEREKNR